MQEKLKTFSIQFNCRNFDIEPKKRDFFFRAFFDNISVFMLFFFFLFNYLYENIILRDRDCTNMHSIHWNVWICRIKIVFLSCMRYTKPAKMIISVCDIAVHVCIALATKWVASQQEIDKKIKKNKPHSTNFHSFRSVCVEIDVRVWVATDRKRTCARARILLHSRT